LVITGSRLGWLPAVNISWTGLQEGGCLRMEQAQDATGIDQG